MLRSSSTAQLTSWCQHRHLRSAQFEWMGSTGTRLGGGWQPSTSGSLWCTQASTREISKKKIGKRLPCKGGQPLEQKVCAGQRRRNPDPWGCPKPKGYVLSKLTKLQSRTQAQGWPCFKQWATRKDLQRSPPALLILGAHFLSQFHGKVKAGGGGGGTVYSQTTPQL